MLSKYNTNIYQCVYMSILIQKRPPPGGPEAARDEHGLHDFLPQAVRMV